MQALAAHCSAALRSTCKAEQAVVRTEACADTESLQDSFAHVCASLMKLAQVRLVQACSATAAQHSDAIDDVGVLTITKEMLSLP